MTNFCLKFVKIYNGQKKFTREFSWLSWQISGMSWTFKSFSCVKTNWDKRSNIEIPQVKICLLCNFTLYFCRTAMPKREEEPGTVYKTVDFIKTEAFNRFQLLFHFCINCSNKIIATIFRPLFFLQDKAEGGRIQVQHQAWVQVIKREIIFETRQDIHMHSAERHASWKNDNKHCKHLTFINQRFSRFFFELKVMLICR